MIVEYIRYHIEDAKRAEDFVAAYTEATKSLRESPHCLAYELSNCTEARADWTLRIEWDSADGHLEGFRKGPHFPPFLKEIRAYVPDIQEMRHYEVHALAWRR